MLTSLPKLGFSGDSISMVSSTLGTIMSYLLITENNFVLDSKFQSDNREFLCHLKGKGF